MKKIISLIVCLCASLLCCFPTVGCNDSGGGQSQEEQSSSTGSSSSNETGETDNTNMYDFINQLTASEYADSTLESKKFGLSNPAIVGVDKESYGETKYAIPEDARFDGEIIDLTDEDMATDGYAALQAAFERAKTANESGKKVKIKLPEGKIVIDTTKANLPATQNAAYILRGYNGLYVEGNNTLVDILCENAAWKGFLHVYDSKDVHLQGITLDYSNSPVVTGEVLSYDVENNSITVQVDEAFRDDLDKNLYNPLMGRNQIYHFNEYDRLTKYSAVTGNYGYWNYGGTIAGVERDDMTLTVKFTKSWKVVDNSIPGGKGNYVSIGLNYYVYNGFHFQNTQEIYCEDVTVNTCPGMSYALIGCKDIYLNKTNVRLNEEDAKLDGAHRRFMTSTADCIHVQSCVGEVTITNCYLERSQDDVLNVKSGFYMQVQNVSFAEKKITLNRYSEENALPKAGDVLEFYQKEDCALKATLTVVSAELVGNSFVVTVKEPVFAVKKEVQYCCNVSTNPQFTLKNNVIGNKPNRGMLIQCRDALLENNTFQNIACGTMMITTEFYNDFNEAMVPRNITIRNNKYMNNNNFHRNRMYGDVSVFVKGKDQIFAPAGTIKGISVTNNLIMQNGNHAVAFYGVGQSEIKNNFLYDCTTSCSNNDTTLNYIVGLTNAADVAISGNYNVTVSSTAEGIGCAGSTDQKKVTLQNNVNLNFEQQDFVSTPVQLAAYAGELNVDGDLSDWEGVTDAIALVGSSFEDGSNADGKYKTDEFNVNMLKVAYKKDKGIYFAFDVKDTDKVFGGTASFWNYDVVEVFFTSALDEMTNADIQLLKEKGSTFQAGFSPAWQGHLAAVRTSEGVLNRFSEWQVNIKETANGYCGEVYVPFSALPGMDAIIAEGKPIALSFVFHDDERGDRQHLQVANVAHWVEKNKYNCSKMPRFIFN